MNFDTTAQRNFFDMTDHQYREEDLLSPPRAQLLEYGDMEAFLPLRPKAKVLDFGCGSGRSTMYFIRKGYNITGYDISDNPLRRLKNLYQQHKQKGWGTLTVTTQMQSKPVYDAVIGTDILHHVPLQKNLQRIFESLKKGGYVVFSEPNPFHLPWYFYYVLGGRPLTVEYGILQCNLWNLRRVLSSVGFVNVRIKGHGILPTRVVPSISGLDYLNAQKWSDLPLLRYFAFRYIISAQKK